MPDFLHTICQAVESKREDLSYHLRKEPSPAELDLRRFIQDHWCPLPAPRAELPARPAFAIDGSMRQLDLDNGCFLVIAQSLCIGAEAFDQGEADVQILPATTERSTAARFADLMQRHRELHLANEVVRHQLPRGSVLYLDGALYGLLPQLYPQKIEGSAALDEVTTLVLDEYLSLLHEARARDIAIVAIAKTSREATHAKIWMKALPDLGGLELPKEMTDSGMLGNWTEGQPGMSEPVVLGRWGFTGGSSDLLDRPEVAASPAIVSFFLRLAPWEDLLRVDLPAHLAGSDARLGDLDGSLLPGGAEALAPLVQVLRTDHGGSEVYNALLYSVDREVRLKRDTVREVYLPMISSLLDLPVRADRSARRFL